DVFISYSKGHDLAYVEKLAEFLARHEIPTWFDRDIVGGSNWAEVIAAKIDACAAMIVVMSLASEKSKWVSREIGRAEENAKPIIPLLRSGRPFFRISDIQFVDVTNGQMPDAVVVQRLRELVARSPSVARNDPDAATLVPSAVALKFDRQ